MTPEQKSAEERREYWRGKVDDHEKFINALLVGLAGGLLAFCADYVKDSVEGFDMRNRILAGIAVAGASLSLAIGAVRTWLHTRLYRFELSDIDYREASSLVDEIKSREDDWAQVAEELVQQIPNLSNEARANAVGKAVAAVYDRRYDALILQARAVIAQGRELKGVRWMEQLAIPQIIFFIGGALAVAAIVFRQLAA